MYIDSRICRLVSSKEEAKPFIEYYKMELKKEFSLFPVYSDFLKQNWLVISGEGEELSSIAAIYLKNCSKSKKNVGWVNFTFSLTSSNISNLYIIDTIIKGNKDEKLYPSIVSMNFIKRAKIISVSDITENDHLLQDFDSYDFYKTVSKLVNKELIAIIKISISKNEINNKPLKENLLKNNFEKIVQIEKVLKKYSNIESTSIKLPKNYNKIIKLIHFTTSEKFQLINLLRSWNNIYSKDLIKEIKNFSKSIAVLNFLKCELKKGQLIW